MAFRMCPEHNLIYEQLRWVERRRIRMQDAVSAHFGREKAQAVMQNLEGKLRLYTAKPLLEIINELEPDVFLRKLAFTIEKQEALLIKEFIAHLSPYPEHVRDQILFGSRCAGQEAARFYLSKNKDVAKNPPLSLTTTMAIIRQLYFNGFETDRLFFTSVRPLNDVMIHYKACPHQRAWEAAEADLEFMTEVQKTWIDGLLDILANNIIHYYSHSIARGEPYSLEHFVYREKHVPWP